MAGNDNAWSGSTADRRLFRASAPALITASAATAAHPWLASTSSILPILADSGGAGVVCLVRMIVRDGFSVAAVNDVVEIVAADSEITSSATVAGTLVGLVEGAATLGAGNLGASFFYLPDATGLISFTITYAAGTTKRICIRHRHINASAIVTLA